MSKFGPGQAELISDSHRKVAPKSGANNEEIIHWAQQSPYIFDSQPLDFAYRQQKQSGFKNRVQKGFNTTVEQADMGSKYRRPGQ